MSCDVGEATESLENELLVEIFCGFLDLKIAKEFVIFQRQ